MASKNRSESDHSPDAIRDLVIEKAAEKLEQKLTQKADKAKAQQQRLSAKAAHAARRLDQLSSQLEALDVWTRAEPAGRRPRYTRAEIAVAAVRIADQEGIDALSMRRLAAELDAATMTLYHYIRTKDELLALVTDTVMGEMVIPAGQALPDDWRAAIRIIANRSRAVLERHPWMFDIAGDPGIGPNSVRHFDQTLQAVASAPGDLEDRLDIASAVDEYVFGYCIMHRNDAQTSQALDQGMLDYVLGLVGTGDYPALSDLIDAVGPRPAWDQIEAHQPRLEPVRPQPRPAPRRSGPRPGRLTDDPAAAAPRPHCGRPTAAGCRWRPWWCRGPCRRRWCAGRCASGGSHRHRRRSGSSEPA